MNEYDNRRNIKYILLSKAKLYSFPQNPFKGPENSFHLFTLNK